LKLQQQWEVDENDNSASGVFPPANCCFSPCGKMVSINSGKGIHLWHVANGELKCILKCFAKGRPMEPMVHRFFPCGKTVVGVSKMGECMYLWDVNDMSKCGMTMSNRTMGHASGYTKLILSIDMSTDGTLILSVGFDVFCLWNATTGELQHTGKVSISYCCSFSPDGALFLVGCHSSLKLYNTTTHQSRCSFEGHAGAVRSCSFIPDGTTVLSGSEDMTMKLWSVSTGQCLRTLSGHSGTVFSCAFSPSGLTIMSKASTYDKPDVRLWTVATGQQQQVLTGVELACISPDGKSILGVCGTTAKIWRVEGLNF
jgi:WD40 repeat protein